MTPAEVAGLRRLLGCDGGPRERIETLAASVRKRQSLMAQGVVATMNSIADEIAALGKDSK